jgi:uncharacterized protein (DUF362 family)
MLAGAAVLAPSCSPPSSAPVDTPAKVEASATPAAATQPVVAIVKGQDPGAMVAEAVALVGGLKPIIKDGQTVVIKPNLVTPDKAERPGLMTDVRVVEGLVKEIRKAARCRLIIAEGCAAVDDHTTMDAFEKNGYGDLAKKYGVELKDLNTDTRITVPVKGLGQSEYEMPETIMKCDVLIDVPVLKTHNLGGITVGIKNLFGLMSVPKIRFHGQLDETLVDIVRMRKPDLVVVDGLVGTEGQGPLHGTPVKMDLVLAGRDVVAVDSVAAAVMGYDPTKIRHLALAGAGGLGENDLAKVIVKGKLIAEVRRLFAYATKEARLSYPMSEDLAGKILGLADATEEFSWHGEVAGKAAVFKPERFKADKAKYPFLQNYGFKVRLMEEYGRIEFVAPFETVIPEHAAVAIEEMRRWIEANLGIKDKGEEETAEHF